MPSDPSLKALKHKTFAQLMSLMHIDPSSVQTKDDDPDIKYFRSLVLPYLPIVSRGVFGGHVMAQSCFAASKTVPPGFICHNLHGYFLLPGKQKQPFYYKVSVIRNGNSYITRQVYVYQTPKILAEGEKFMFQRNELCYVAIMSFKRPSREDALLKHQHELPAQFAVERNRKLIPSIPLAPDIDTPTWIRLTEEKEYDVEEEIHPIELRKLNVKAYNADKPITRRRQIQYLKHHDKLLDFDDTKGNTFFNQNLHVAALLYVSDRNSLFTIPNMHDQIFTLRNVASIDHAFVLHKLDVQVDLDWMVMETFSSAAYDNRGLYQGHIYDSKNQMVCSFMQDGILKAYDSSHVPKEQMYYQMCINKTMEKQGKKTKDQNDRGKL